MLLRIFTKLVILQTDLGADDWTIIATVLSGIPSSVLNIHGLTASTYSVVLCIAQSSISFSFIPVPLLPPFSFFVFSASRGLRNAPPDRYF